MTGWGVTNVEYPKITAQGETLLVSVIPSELMNIQDPVYWIAPYAYLGNRVRENTAHSTLIVDILQAVR